MQDQQNTFHDFQLDLGRITIKGEPTVTTLDFVRSMKDAVATFDAKQKDYGSGNIAKFGLDGVLIRMSDKIERLIHLRNQKTDPVNESVEDSYLDLSIYGIIALMCLDGVWKGVEQGGQPSPRD
tara:strand:- start:16450 stop:16821 length:372 start_codon:yes stop_codon:yes gene_type:complete